MEFLPWTTIYTIGHGRHPLAYFVELLKRYHIVLVCDVRSVARSRWPQFNWAVLADALRERGIGYEHLPECGGKAPAPPLELARGLDRIMELAAEGPMVLMCSESQPLTKHARQKRANCHRVGMLATPLRASFISYPTEPQSNSTNRPCPLFGNRGLVGALALHFALLPGSILPPRAHSQ
jgi:hypothetical protein